MMFGSVLEHMAEFMEDPELDRATLLLVLQMAVRTGHTALVQFALQHPALSQTDVPSWLTTLAAIHGRADVLRMLLSHGAVVPDAANLLAALEPQNAEVRSILQGRAQGRAHDLELR